MIQTTQGERIDKPVVAGKVRVYYVDGTPHDCWPVDASEMVSMGSYFWEPPEVTSNDQRIVVDEDEADSEAEAEAVEDKPKRSRKAK